MKPQRCLAALVFGVCATAFSGCAHLMTDPGYPAEMRDRLEREHMDRMQRESREYQQNMAREMARVSPDPK